MSAYTRDRETAKAVAGVRLEPRHVLSFQVHAFRHWTGERELETWCGIGVDLSAGGVQTTETISCQTCAEASWQAFRAR